MTVSQCNRGCSKVLSIVNPRHDFIAKMETRLVRSSLTVGKSRRRSTREASSRLLKPEANEHIASASAEKGSEGSLEIEDKSLRTFDMKSKEALSSAASEAAVECTTVSGGLSRKRAEK